MAILDSTKLIEIFVACDDFSKELEIYLVSRAIGNPTSKAGPDPVMSDSEIMTILIFFHLSGMRCFKWYYQHIIKVSLRSYFPNTVDYSRFVTLMERQNGALALFLQACRLADPTTHNYIDSKPLVVCHNKRIKDHKVFDGIAQRGKSSTGWFFGFKLHAVVNQFGQLVVFQFTPGNITDNNMDLLEGITAHLKGFLYGDKGYLTSLKSKFKERGLNLITKVRKNMKKQYLTPEQKYYLKHRGIVESVFDLAKHLCQIEHSRHRKEGNFITNALSALLAYTFLDKTPSFPQYEDKNKKLTKSMELEYSEIVLI